MEGMKEGGKEGESLWFKTTENQDVSTGPFACPFTCLLRTARFARSLHCTHSFTCLLALSLTRSQACGNVTDKMSQHQAVLNHSGEEGRKEGSKDEGRREKRKGGRDERRERRRERRKVGRNRIYMDRRENGQLKIMRRPAWIYSKYDTRSVDLRIYAPRGLSIFIYFK